MNKHLSSIKKTAVLVAVSWLAIPAFAGIGGFVDAQITDTENTNPNSEIADAAVYVSKELGRGKLMLDLPFSFTSANADSIILKQEVVGLPLDVNPYATAFRAFNKKAQAYISWGYDFGLSWQLGRFDSPFLNESQDTVGLNALTTQGTLFAALPNMHNGLMLTFANGPISVMALASRADGRVTSKADGENLEWGFLAKYAQGGMYAGAGWYLHKPNTETHSLVEVMLGTKMGDISVDAQALFSKAAVANMDSGFGAGATIGYQLDKMWSFAVRPNYTSKLAANNSNEIAQLETNGATVANGSWHQTGGSYRTFQVAVGPQAQVSDDLRIRANFVWDSVKATENVDAVSSKSWALSAVYKF